MAWTGVGFFTCRANLVFAETQVTTLEVGSFSASFKIEIEPIKWVSDMYITYFSNTTAGGVQKLSDSLSEKWFKQYATATKPGDEHYSAYKICVDLEGNAYFTCLCSDKPWYVNVIKKITPDGTLAWTSYFPSFHTINSITVSPDGDYLYFIANYNLGGVITKIDASTGVEVTDGGFPITTEVFGVISETNWETECIKALCGKDGYLYIAHNNTKKESNAKVTKIDTSDGSIEWQYQNPQGIGASELKSINDIDVNDNGYVAIAIGKGSESLYFNDGLKLLNPDGTLRWAVRSGDNGRSTSVVVTNDNRLYSTSSVSVAKSYEQIVDDVVYAYTELLPVDDIYYSSIRIDPSRNHYVIARATPQLSTGGYTKIDIDTEDVVWRYLGKGGVSYELGSIGSDLAIIPIITQGKEITFSIRCPAEVNIGSIHGIIE